MFMRIQNYIKLLSFMFRHAIIWARYRYSDLEAIGVKNRTARGNTMDDKALADAALKMAMMADAGVSTAGIAEAGAGPGWTFRDGGKGLDGMLCETGLFPSYFIDMAGVGLATGRLPECLKSLHDYYLRSWQIKRSARQALYQPLSMLALSVLVFLVVLVKIFPVFADAYQAAGMAVGPAMSAMLSLGACLSARPFAWALAAAVPAAAIFAMSRIPAVRARARTAAGRTATGRAVRNAKLVQALSMGLDSGMDAESAMAMALDVSGTRPGGMLDGIRSGHAGAVLNGHGIVSLSDARILEAGEKAGNLPDAMAYVAGSMMDEADARLRRLSARIEPAITLVGAGLTGGIIILSMLPLLDAMSSIG